ncbi:uncharacterized protein LOC135713427 [Ochlerotatus camptorhynchus]|uniref:uncharacterized protein LOC135713427 n=1 Tax=Ochlerotatus camptorhynchus TaxID=644619 RepID=UPI0031D04BF3
MSNGGKFVRAPIANDVSHKSKMSEKLSDGVSFDFDDLDVAAHETVETNNSTSEETDDVTGRLHRLERMVENFIGQKPSEVDLTANEANQNGNNDFQPSSGSNQTDRGCNIRWDLIPKFPKDIPSNKLWECWQSFIENFEIAASLSTVTASADRAKLLYLSIGKNLQDIINAADLQPNYQDPRCYSTLVAGVNNYFRSMTDTAAEHEAFQAMRQTKGESIVTIHARLTQKVRLCGYSPTDQVRFVLAQLLKGMHNRELAMAARTYGHEANYIVQAATRVEAYEASEQSVETSTSDVLAVNRKREPIRESGPFQKMRKNEENRAYSGKTSRGPSQDYRQGQRTHCWRCGFLFHKRDTCPALDKQCNTCGRVGHYAVTCRSKVKKTSINDVQENPRANRRSNLPLGWTKDFSDEQV